MAELEADGEVGALLSELQAASSSGDKDKLLLALLRAWDRWRHPRLGDAIGTLTRQHPEQVPLTPLDWHHAADRRDPLAVPSLLGAPWRRDRPSVLRRKLLAMARFPADPRIAAFAEEIQAHFLEERPGARETREAASALAALHGPRGDEPALDPRLQRLLDQLRAQPELEEQLLASVYTRPDDDGPRLVYADYLIERGDPMGRLLSEALGQRLTPSAFHRLAPEVRERWCRATLGPGIAPHQVLFWRGFPWWLYLDGARPLPRPIPGWSTLAFLVLADLRPEQLPWLAGLRELPNLRGALLSLDAVLLGQALPHLERVPLREVGVPADSWRPQYALARFWPSLERLVLLTRGPVRLDAEQLGELAPQLHQVHLKGELRATMAQALAASEGADAQLRSIGVSLAWPLEPAHSQLHASLERDERTRFTQLTLAGLDWSTVPYLAELLRDVQPERLTALTLQSALKGDKGFRQRLARATPRFASLRRIVEPP